jgi:hypothetical protein
VYIGYTSFELIGEEFGIKTKGIQDKIITQVTIKLRLVMMILLTVLKRYIKCTKYYLVTVSVNINLLARNWAQVKVFR